MSVAISFRLRDGVVLARDGGERLAARAFELVEEFARLHGWTDLGGVDTRGVPRRDAWAPLPICGHRWRVSGGARFTLARIAGTGQLAETCVRTSDADDPSAAHRSVVAVLARLNAEVYGGRIDVSDETGYAETADEHALLVAFSVNVRVVNDIASVLTDEGWAVKEDLGANRAALVPFEDGLLTVDEVLEAEIIEEDTDWEERDNARREHAAISTLLEQFLKAHGIRPTHLARESGYSRRFLLNLRMGRAVPSIACVAHIVAALRGLTRVPLDAVDVFERALPGAPRPLLPPNGDGA